MNKLRVQCEKKNVPSWYSFVLKIGKRQQLSYAGVCVYIFFTTLRSFSDIANATYTPHRRLLRPIVMSTNNILYWAIF